MDGRSVGLGALEGLDLGHLLASGPLSPAQAAGVGLGILSALEDLHEAGRSAASLTADDVLIGPDGRVRLRAVGQDHPSSSELAYNVRQAGRLLCAALGVAVEPDPGGLRPAERAMPAVVATARAIANGAMGRNVALARAQFADTAGSLVAPERLRLSETELAEHIRTVPVPSSVPAPAAAAAPHRPEPSTPPVAQPAPPRPAPQRPLTNWDRRPTRLVLDDARGRPRAGSIAAIVGVLLVLVVAAGLGAFVISKLMVTTAPSSGAVAVGSSPAPRQASPSAPPRSSPSAAPTVATLPTFAPPAQGTIKSVSLAPNGDCTVGASCALELTLNFTKAPAQTDYAWAFKAVDPCTGTTTDVGTGHFTAKAGWIQIISDSRVTLPAARGKLLLVAVTTSPDQAQSPALTVGQGSC